MHGLVLLRSAFAFVTLHVMIVQVSTSLLDNYKLLYFLSAVSNLTFSLHFFQIVDSSE
jgi:hypothetical protein